jgi:ribonuclease BN (tRNA processing enzyme)
MLRLVVLGSGDAFGSGGRNFSGFLLTDGNFHVLLDCGPSTLPALKAKGLDPAQVKMILVSHCHGDHFGGIPFFFIDYQFISERTSALVIAGPEGIEQRCDDLIRAAYPDILKAHKWRFQVRYMELMPGEDVREGDITIETFAMEHGAIPARGYRIGWKGVKVGYTGDTRWTTEIPRLARGCDLLLCECFFFQEDHHSHIRYTDLALHRGELDAKRIVLFHLGPEMMQHMDRVELEVAHDGMVMEIDSP